MSAGSGDAPHILWCEGGSDSLHCAPKCLSYSFLNGTETFEIGQTDYHGISRDVLMVHPHVTRGPAHKPTCTCLTQTHRLLHSGEPARCTGGSSKQPPCSINAGGWWDCTLRKTFHNGSWMPPSAVAMSGTAVLLSNNCTPPIPLVFLSYYLHVSYFLLLLWYYLHLSSFLLFLSFYLNVSSFSQLSSYFRYPNCRRNRKNATGTFFRTSSGSHWHVMKKQRGTSMLLISRSHCSREHTTHACMLLLSPLFFLRNHCNRALATLS